MSDGYGEDLLPPQIYAINPKTCFSNDPNVRCSAGDKNNVTINGKNGVPGKDYDGDGVAEDDLNNNGVFDGIVERGTYTAVMHFFAFADHNRMPIKRITVDWGDGGLPVSGGHGFYKNRKPYCGDETASGVQECGISDGEAFDSNQMTCGNDSQCVLSSSGGDDCLTVNNQFGNSTRACEEDYFEFVHAYTCSAVDLDVYGVQVDSFVGSNPDIYSKLKAFGLEDDEEVCSFTPRVQVLDNWGWCNGSQPDENGEFTIPFEGGYPNDYGGSGNGCDSDTVRRAYTPYKGEIVIVPNQ